MRRAIGEKPADGNVCLISRVTVMLARMEFMVNQHIGIHPMALADLGKIMAPACSPQDRNPNPRGRFRAAREHSAHVSRRATRAAS